MKTNELAPGITRVEVVSDDKLHGYHVLDGAHGPIIVDPGYKDAPTEVYEPYLAEQGQSLSAVSATIITHADADHHGGLESLLAANPRTTVFAHRADVPLIESKARIMTERYGRHEADGIVYDAELKQSLREMMGADTAVDVALTGGEAVTVGDRRLRVLHTPGHTAGHLMLYDRQHDLILGGDGFFGRGLRSVDGDYLQPPPYLYYPEYRTTTRRVQTLAPETVSFTHYEVLRGEDIEEFVSETIAFATELEELARQLAAEEPVTLEEAIEQTVDRKGSFGFDLDLALPLNAHFESLVDRGFLTETTKDGVRAWVEP